MLRRVLFVGDEHHPEFHAAVEWLRGNTEFASAPSLPVALRGCPGPRGEAPREPEVVVIGQARLGQFAAGEVEQLHRQAPLARLVALLGSWCEGEIRTGRPWPGVLRVYWHQWQPRFAREILRLAGDREGTWHLPRTTTDVEQLLHLPPRPCRSPRGLIAIHTCDAISFDCLADACLASGFAAARVPPSAGQAVRGAAAAIWESRVGSDVEFESLRQFAANLAPVPVVALLSFPRLDDCSRARAAGAAAIVGKPFLVDDLLWHLDAAIRATPASAHEAA